MPSPFTRRLEHAASILPDDCRRRKGLRRVAMPQARARVSGRLPRYFTPCWPLLLDAGDLLGAGAALGTARCAMTCRARFHGPAVLADYVYFAGGDDALRDAARDLILQFRDLPVTA